MHGRESKAGVQLGFKCMAGKAWRQVHGRESMTDAHLAAEKQYLGRLFIPNATSHMIHWTQAILATRSIRPRLSWLHDPSDTSSFQLTL
eukprot:scaffold245329_cov21-Tisochrysis_lutea.AAC.1